MGVGVSESVGENYPHAQVLASDSGTHCANKDKNFWPSREPTSPTDLCGSHVKHIDFLEGRNGGGLGEGAQHFKISVVFLSLHRRSPESWRVLSLA